MAWKWLGVEDGMYPSDLSDAQWALLAPLLVRPTPPQAGGRPRKYALRDLVNGIFYVTKTGCQWRQLPHDFPPWKSVYDAFWRWRHDGSWDRVLAVLREQARERAGRKPAPSVAIIDSQSIKTIQKGGSAAMMPAKRPRGASDISR